MGTGVIFGVVAVGFLAYLVPWFISRRGHAEDLDENEERFASSMTLIKRGTSAFVDNEDPLLEVTTPMTRRAALADVAATHARAAVRRRRGLLLHLVLVVAVVAAAALSPLVPWWAVAVPGGMTLLYLVVSRYSVTTLHKQLDERVSTIESGWEDDTIIFEVPSDLRSDAGAEMSIELSGPIETGSLWDPIPVTQPTYISKPMAPRTVRTIDLSTPPAAVVPTPVTAEPLTDVQGADVQGADERGSAEADESPRAVNE